MILDLFAGPGGWDEGLRLLGRTDVVGVEMDAACAATRRQAGHDTIEADVRTLDPADYRGWEGMIASPPCQTFSSAGLQRGLSDLRGQLVYEVLRFAEDMRPAWIACENVKEVLPIWRAFAAEMRSMGYHAWAGLLNAADFGIPQSRKRAFLLASMRPFNPPTPTHTAHGAEGLFGEVHQWTTMAQALGLKESDLQPNQRWALTRPATTVVRSFRPDVIAAPGYRLAGDGPRQNTPGSITVTDEQLCVLQGVRPDYPFQGGKTKRLSLIGAFLPPAWGAAILATVINAPEVCMECGNDAPTDGMTWCLECLSEVEA
jgi:DNA (cytosine-5)-methyltransferase 1